VARQLAALVSSLDKLDLIGRGRSPAADFLLLFGGGEQKKLAAWTVGPAKKHISLGSRLCIAAAGTPSTWAEDTECEETDQVVEIEPISLMLTGQPVIVPLRKP
jgi:hypothetical protein